MREEDDDAAADDDGGASSWWKPIRQAALLEELEDLFRHLRV